MTREGPRPWWVVLMLAGFAVIVIVVVTSLYVLHNRSRARPVHVHPISRQR